MVIVNTVGKVSNASGFYLRASEFNCAHFRPISCAVFQFFDKIQFKPYGTQEMQLIIAQFLSTTKYSI